MGKSKKDSRLLWRAFKAADEQAEMIKRMDDVELTTFLQRLFRTDKVQDELIVEICNRLGL